ncbi:hypothetical protein LPJ55_005389 [Coemansia sp. RSA 990]|nr:translation initiation factor eIF 4e-like domain-containing protein [Coemansia mojavensis]KAJ1738893.1 hypothetical protein LPJ68_005155 [Coemansia sp. RSA 1086]KAJ1747566.1 hypothetical protein LPJ79_005160 [Coemansia sp. RSA 1821]KAJ1869387.1 hypothetical protein LPJ55_005389 [Coemansia sp. RSA 990]KAJ2667809.1 hypothetical protein IWW42_005674 [Coemansia sp. RSA 1085]
MNGTASEASAATKTASDTFSSTQAAKPASKLVQYRRERLGSLSAPSSHDIKSNQQAVWNSSQRLFADNPSDSAAASEDSGEQVHLLRFAWSFWFIHRVPGHKINDYEAAMTKIATFDSVEGFWACYSHLKRADQVPTITDYHMFRAGVRPVWEDPANASGGKWMIRLKKGISPRMWEKLAMAVVGGVFGLADEICGIVLSIRNSEDIISLWNKTALDTKSTLHIRDTMKLVMGLPHACILEYKAHNDSLRDNSSFRNTDIYK